MGVQSEHTEQMSVNVDYVLSIDDGLGTPERGHAPGCEEDF